jgi:N,N-dimethylformamidase
MATSSSLSRVLALVATALVLGPGAAAHRPDWTAQLDADELDLVGFAGHVPDSTKPRITAFFPRESYAPGTVAELQITDSARDVGIQVMHAGTGARRVHAHDVMTGSPMTAVRWIGSVDGRRAVTVRLGSTWPSGFYFVRLTSGRRIGYATFVLRPRRLGEHSVAIVLPTETWQAYNFRDDNGDHRPDTWYAGGSTARLFRPFLNRGVPPHYAYYDVNFLHWAYATHHDADYLSDAELRSTSGAQLRKAYQLLIFEGHHEYATQHEYDAVETYRDLGGNLMFLSANNFFWKITIDRGVMTRVAKWRDLGRPEAALIGVEYYHNDMGEHRGPWIVRPAAARLPWLLNETGLEVGTAFGSGGIEADDVTSDSPRNLIVVAAIPNLYGDGRNADMTYYETPAGAKVFAAGAFTLAGSVWQGHVRELLSNLWERLAKD